MLISVSSAIIYMHNERIIEYLDDYLLPALISVLTSH